MEKQFSTKVDPNRAAQFMLDLTYSQSVEKLLEKVISTLIDNHDTDIVQVWLIEKGDRCTTCPAASACADHSRCLHLAAARTSDSILKESASLFTSTHHRIPLGVGYIGRAAQGIMEEEPIDLTQIPDDNPELGWTKETKVRELGLSPIVFRGETLALFCIYTCNMLLRAGKPWGRIFSGYIGAALANARAFEEIQGLKDQLELQNAYLREVVVEAKAFGELVGQSSALQRIVTQIELVAPTEASVLILGETGTGKELVAYEIHNRSNRKKEPLVRVNCASIPRELFESEFFGHVKGAFTGAFKDRAGRFETAEGGTLFLDEISEIPMEMQGKLLRVLQEKRYERVGDDRTRSADVRIIAAPNRDLKQAIETGKFREDLYYRINVFPIEVASLRERKDDIPLLVKHFIELSLKELRCPPPRLTRSALNTLLNYDWPGNIRELRNIVERAVILANGGTLQFNLPTHSGTPSIPTLPEQSKAKNTDTTMDAEKNYLTEVEIMNYERENLRKILQKTNWKIKGPNGAAELLGIKPTTLLSRIKKMGITRQSL